MSWSLGEIRALSIKATKGAGFSWGEAEEVGFAVEWLEARCAPGVEALAFYLSNTCMPDVCPIHIGCQISDVDNLERYFPLKISQLVLAAPFISRTLEHETVELTFNDTAIVISDLDIFTTNYSPSAHICPELVSLTSGGIIPSNSLCSSRVSSEQAVYIDILNGFAHHTYAPSTESSRLAGAGAGVSDND